MRVLVITDEDGHINAFDITSDEQRKQVYFDIIRSFYRNGTGNWGHSDDRLKEKLQPVIDAINAHKSVEEVLELYQDNSDDIPQIGGRGDNINEVNVQGVWDHSLARSLV